MNNKPFHMLVIESPGHYEDYYDTINGERIYLVNGKEKAFIELSDLCRTYNIPVRVTNGNNPTPITPEGKLPDWIIKDFFMDCYYVNSSDFSIMNSVGNLMEFKVMITGGIFDLVDYNLELVNMGKASGVSLTNEQVLVDGCVPGAAEAINKELIENEIKPTIYIDPRSTISFTSGFDLNLIYQYHGLGPLNEIGGYNYIIVNKIPRDNILHT